MSSEPATTTSPSPPAAAEKPNPFAALGSSGSQFGAGLSGGFSFGVPGAVAPKAEEGGEEGGDGEDEAAAEEECQVGLSGVLSAVLGPCHALETVTDLCAHQICSLLCMHGVCIPGTYTAHLHT